MLNLLRFIIFLLFDILFIIAFVAELIGSGEFSQLLLGLIALCSCGVYFHGKQIF